MAATILDPVSFGIRMAGTFAFVFVATPFGPFQNYVMPETPEWPSIPMILTAIIVLCMHVYFAYRAYYALKVTGIVILTAVYLLLAYYVISLFDMDVMSSGNVRWHSVIYLTFLYTYGICYNFIDSHVSGLLHTKTV